MVRWLSSFLGDRYTVLALPGFEQPRAPIATGIPQRLPLSPILYSSHPKNSPSSTSTTPPSAGRSPGTRGARG